MIRKLMIQVASVFFCFVAAVIADAKTPDSRLKSYKIFVILDTVDEWSAGVRDGFIATMNKKLAAKGIKAEYTSFNTQINTSYLPEILKAIEDGNPDLICTINYPSAFADNNIAKRFKDPIYRFVSMNPIPVETGLIQSWEKPGGNITGVSVFLQQNSALRLMKKIDPRVRKMVFVSWDAMTEVNAWYERELRRACREERIELVDFIRVSCIEDEYEIFKKYDSMGPEYFAMEGITAFVHRDGTPANANIEMPEFIRKNIKRLQFVTFDETSIKTCVIGGVCVIWYDIGAQLAEKGAMILDGKNPGDMPWDYPRKYNILLNIKKAKDSGIRIPLDLINAAYRVYTDYNGSFAGKGK
jgi:putative ABC transport system substrate-binding protein